MKNKERTSSKSTLPSIRVIVGTLMAIAGFVIFVLSATGGVIEPSTANILIGVALLVGGLLIANSITVVRFLSDLT